MFHCLVFAFSAAGLVYLPSLPSFLPHFLLGATACLCLGLFFKLLRRSCVFQYLICCGLGASLGAFQLKAVVDAQLPANLDAQTFTLDFEISSIPDYKSRSVVFKAKIIRLDCLGCNALDWGPGESVRLSWYQPKQKLAAGQVWRAAAKLRRPRGFVNPHSFDYQAWLLGQGIVANGYLVSGPRTQLEPVTNLASLREALAIRVLGDASDRQFKKGDANAEAFLAKPQILASRPFFAALLVGDKSSISAEQWQVLQRTGTIHLMAISGLHVGLVAAIGFGLGLYLAKLLAILNLSCAASLRLYCPAALSVIFALIYAALAGFSIPTQRALLACVLLNISVALGLRLSPWFLVSLALALVCLIEPFALLNQGFVLSFTAVAVLIYLMSGRSTKLLQRLPQTEAEPLPSWSIKAALRRICQQGHGFARLQTALFLGLFLPVLAFGQSNSFISPFANLVAVPVVSLLVVPGLLLASALQCLSLESLAQPLLWTVDWVFQYLWTYLEFGASTLLATWWIPLAIDSYLVLAGILALACLLAPRGLALLPLGLILVALLVFTKSQNQKVEISVFDVGQGSAVLLQSEGHALLYDTGPKFSEDFDAGSRIIAPVLKRKGIKQLDLVVSHGDSDHSGGLKALLQQFEIQHLILGEEVVLGEEVISSESLSVIGDASLSAQYSERATWCNAGDRINLGALKLTTLWPIRAGNTLTSAGHGAASLPQAVGNNASCVLMVEFEHMPHGAEQAGTFKLLLTGDIDKKVEKVLLQHYSAQELKADILISPHHGSISSSRPEFLQVVQPSWIIVSSGFKNRYGHPHPKVLARYQALGAEVLNTATSGAIIVTWREAGGLALLPTRTQSPRLWYD